MKRVEASTSPETFESGLQQVRWHVRLLYIVTSLCLALTVTCLLLMRSTYVTRHDVTDTDFEHLQVVRMREVRNDDVTDGSGNGVGRAKRSAVWDDYGDDVLRQRYPLPFMQDEPDTDPEEADNEDEEGSGAEANSGVWLTSYLKIPVSNNTPPSPLN